jgi:hypothetical protein
MGERIDHQKRGCLAPEDRSSLSRDGGDEEDALGVHRAIVAKLGVWSL